MRRVTPFLCALVCAGLALEAPARAADPGSSSPAPAPDFDALVKKGDQARIAGKWSVALKAYADALEIRKDPLVAGRIGLVLVEFREYDVAASKLFSAIEKGAGVNDAERTRFFQAFLVAKNQTCRLDVTIAQSGAKFEVDGEVWPDDRREFWTFIKPGKHTLRVRLDGFEDETREIDAPRGRQLPIKIDLRPVKPKEEPAKQPDPEPPPKAPDPPTYAGNLAPMVIKDKPLAPTNLHPKNGLVVSLLEPEQACKPIPLPVPRATDTFPWWAKMALSCHPTPLAEACDEAIATQCLPPLPAEDGWRYCVHRDELGVHECPSSLDSKFCERVIAYGGYVDACKCTACGCKASGGSCRGTLRVYKDDSCSTNELSVEMVSSEIILCSNLSTPGSAVGSKEMTDVVYVPGSCEATGGLPIGTAYADESTAVTWCCMAAPVGMNASSQ